MSMLPETTIPVATRATTTTTPTPTSTRPCTAFHTAKRGLQRCGCNLAWIAVEPRLLAANRAFTTGSTTYFEWRDEIRACRVALGLEVV